MERSDIGRTSAASEVGSYSTYNLSYSQVDTQVAPPQDLWMREQKSWSRRGSAATDREGGNERADTSLSER